MKKIFGDKNCEKRIYIVYACIAIVAFVFYLTHSNARGLNKDDIASIHVIAGEHGIAELFARNVEMGLQPPLAAILFYLWSRITPATEMFIKIPSIFAVAVSVYVVCCIGKRLKNDFTGMIAGILLAVSNYSFVECVFSARSYGFFVLFSAIVYWFHLKITEEWEAGNVTWKTGIAYGLSGALLAYTHYFGILLVFLMGILDLLKVIRKGSFQEQKKNILLFAGSYVLAALVFLPWGLNVIVNEYQRLGVVDLVWTSRPTISSIFNMIYYFFSNVFILAVFAVLVILLIWRIAKQKDRALWMKMTGYYIAVCVIYLGVAFVYSTYIKADGSMWVRRYFCCLMPAIYLVCALALDEAVCAYKKTKIAAYIFLMVIVVANWYNIPMNTKENQETVYGNTIDYLEKNHVNEQEQTVIYSAWWGDAFNYFYTDNFRNENIPAVLELNGADIPETIQTIYIVTPYVEDWDTYITDDAFELDEVNEEAQVVRYIRR